VMEEMDEFIRENLAKPLVQFARTREYLPQKDQVEKIIRDEVEHTQELAVIHESYKHDIESNDEAFDTDEQEEEAGRLEDEDSVFTV
jgi:hypothetical protein